ncbi:MAG TPA: GAF domain-containing protein [Solirubrobacteraceae bacterium]|nr:GAF domain-containing protein [Solirubrobacteraceae bacterium]
MSELRRLVDGAHQAFNARELDAWREILAPDVELMADGARFHGLEAVLAHAADVVRELPGIRIEHDRVISESGDTIVVEAELVDGSGRRPEGTLCELWRVADGRLVACHSYSAAHDRGGGTTRAAGSVEEQAALRRVATLVARAVSRDELLAAVNEEIARLAGADPMAMARFDSDDTVTILAGWTAGGAELPIGERRPLDPLLRSVRDTGRPKRLITAELPPTGSFVATARELGIRSSVAVPIAVDGHVWGVAFACTTRPEPFPDDTEARIGGFTELVGTAIANAQVRAELTRLADEQAALRRVAELVARGVEPEEVFAVVAKELCNLFGNTTMMFRYDPDDISLCVAAWHEGGESELVGFRARPPEGGLLARVRRTGRPGRIDNERVPPGELGERMRHLLTGCVAGGPITVEGRSWGLLCVVFPAPEPPPRDVELRIARFAELASTAIANAQARGELRTLVEEQRGLRRVATLVARGAPQGDVFDAVASEASRLLGGKSTGLLRFDPDGVATTVAVSGGPGTVGMRRPITDENITAQVWRTRRPARIDSFEGVPGGELARRLGVRAAVGAPIGGAGGLWGLVIAMSRDQPLPAAAEDRLAQFADLVAAAIGNAASRAELTASRARVVATADETRRRIQRDVHDGAQQRLVHTVITLKLAEDALGPNAGPVGDLVAEALEHAERATAELRELAHGVLPPALTRGGLYAGIESLVGGVDLPVTVDAPTERLPPALETTAYFVIAEGLTNVVKHAGADSAHIRVVVDGGVLRVEVRDDGSGGADLTRGSGLVGLTDRVGALGGTIAVRSPPGEGTTLAVALPIEQRSAIATG